MQAKYLDKDHIAYRKAVQEFIKREITPYHEEWEEAEIVSRDVWLKAGENGLLCMDVPEEYGGLEIDDYRYLAILTEELAYACIHGPGFGVTNELVVPYLMAFATHEQKARWLPRLASGEAIGALAMTEPNAGSDLQSIQTMAVRDGDDYIVNGQKTFITNGILCDIVIVYCKTTPGAGAEGTTLLVIERGMEGFERGRNLKKLGLHAQDTGELFFDNVPVPAKNVLGNEGQGFLYLMHNLPQERLSIAIGALAQAEAALEHTLTYCKERTAFGRPIGSFQNSRFKLAEMKTELHASRVFLDHCIMLQCTKDLSAEEAAMAKWWCSDVAKRVIDECLQLHGGYGYMMEYP
ncbi:MAG: acyl-CoA dehydrogenase family protein, partial [Chloroflexota bacterium]